MSATNVRPAANAIRANINRPNVSAMARTLGDALDAIQDNLDALALSGSSSSTTSSASSALWSLASGFLYPTDLTNVVTLGMSSTDAGGASLVAAQSINVVTATVNASICGIFCVAGARAGLASSKTGTGTNLPLCFDTAGSERVRIETGGRMLIGLTSTDIAAGSLVAADYIACVTASTNASTVAMQVVAGSYGSIGTNATGAGTQLPFQIFTAGNERLRILSNAATMLIGQTATDVTGASLVCANTINVVTATANASICGLFCVAGSRAGIASSKTGTGTNLPLCFDVAGSERARFDTGGRLLIGLTSTDIAAGSLVTLGSNGYFGCVSATTNASTLIMQLVPGSFGSIGTNATGTGTQLPFQIYTSGAERMRILATAATVLIGQTATDVSGASLVCASTINVVTATANASICGLFCVAGSRAGIASSKTGTGTNLPLCFDCAGAERMRITTGGLVYINRTTDDGTGATVQINGSLSVNGTLVTVP